MTVQSPCVQICAIDEQSELCTGCGRSLTEIRSWIAMSDEDRAQIMAELEDRMQQHFGAS